MSAVNLSSFLNQFKANQKITLKAVDKTIGQASQQLFDRIVQRTPVGDPSLWSWPAHSDYTPGTLKAGWQITNTTASRGDSGRFQSDAGVLSNYGLMAKIGGANNKVYATIYNEVPYAQRVENGWSTKQAPQGMMRVSIMEFNSILTMNAYKNKTR